MGNVDGQRHSIHGEMRSPPRAPGSTLVEEVQMNLPAWLNLQNWNGRSHFSPTFGISLHFLNVECALVTSDKVTTYYVLSHVVCGLLATPKNNAKPLANSDQSEM